MRAAAVLLSSSRSFAALKRVVEATGLFATAAPVDAPTRVALGMEHAAKVELARGTGALCLLLLEIHGLHGPRESLQRIARRLEARAPHVLWLVALVDEQGTHAGFVGWTSGDRIRIATFLWEPDRVVDSDAETLCALAGIRANEDVLLHARCVEVLGRGALTRRFYRALEAQVSALAVSVPAAPADGRALALLYVSRLLFLSFLEAKGWLNRDRSFLSGQFDECLRREGQFHRRVLLPLFFGTLNTPVSRRALAARAFGDVPFLNGGLFSRSALERRLSGCRFGDDQMGSLLGDLFARFRFVAREDSAEWSEASVDPEMLGRAFESLMAASERRAGGVYYTPHELVSRVSEQALTALEPQSLSELGELRVLDPACGSGAFLVFILERLAERRLQLGERGSVADVRRDVLARSIFGVDLNPTAVWLCELRLWLSVVIENHEADPRRIPSLPNLDRNIRVGDALTGTAFARGVHAYVGSARAARLRDRYVRATGSRKAQLARALDREERRRILTHMDHDIVSAQYERQELLIAHRWRDLFGERGHVSAESKRELRQLRDRLRLLRRDRRRISDGGALPFSFAAVFADTQRQGGFDLIVGNPPWVRLHRIPLALRLQFKQTYEVFRGAQWRAGAASANAGAGFASQVDLAALFVERSVALLREGGALGLLLPMKLWRSLSGGGVRSLLLTRTQLLRVEDLSESKHAFDAAVYPSLVVARSGGSPDSSEVIAARDDVRGRVDWSVPAGRLSFDETPGAPWLLLRPPERAAFDRLRAAGPPLAASHFGSPRLGVKSGCNSAFIVRVTDTSRDFASIVNADGEAGSVEIAMLRPALRGEAVQPWRRRPCDDSIIWTHDASGEAMKELPDRTRAWLRRHYGDLASRTDARHARRWWSLFRVDAACALDARVVWADFGRVPRALVLGSGDPVVPLNTCYVIRCADECDAGALASLLNCDLIANWLNALAEPARGGYRRYLGWTVGQLPIPRDWPRARAILGEAMGANGDVLREQVLAAFGIPRSDVDALLEP